MRSTPFQHAFLATAIAPLVLAFAASAQKPAVLNPAPTYVDAPAQAPTQDSGQDSGQDSSSADGASATPDTGDGGTIEQQSQKQHQPQQNQNSQR